MTEPGNHLRLSVVMPVYNERSTIEEILCRVQDVAIEKEIIIVDDGSTDGTREFLQELSRKAGQEQAGGALPPRSAHPSPIENTRILFQERNSGKGAALRRGFREARGEIVIIQDAEGRVLPQEYTRTGHVANQASVGPSLLWAPFFVVVHGIVFVSNHLGAHIPADGFSRPYT